MSLLPHMSHELRHFSVRRVALLLRHGLIVLLALLGFASAAFAINVSSYVPHVAGSQWSYVSNNLGTKTTTIGSPVTLPNGVVAIPATLIDSSQSGISTTYTTVDANGVRRHQEYMSSVYVSGYGNTSVTAVYTPALSLAPADVTVGSTYASTGSVTLSYTNVTTVTLNYSATNQVVGFETVSNNSGTQSWSAVKIVHSLTMSGTINGQFVTITSVTTSWMVDGLGSVQIYTPNASQVMETWKLTSTNLVPVTTTTTTTSTTTTPRPTTTTAAATTTTAAAATTSTVASTTTTTQAGSSSTLNIVAGWNLVGNGMSHAVSVSAAFADPNWVSTVWKWVASSDTWAFYTPTLGDGGAAYAISKGYSFLATINAGEGFWVNANDSFTVPLPSDAPINSISFQDGKPGALKQGWNLISIGNTRTPSGFNAGLSALPPTAGVIPINITTLWAWDNPLGRWYFYAPNLEAQGGTALTDYITSKGYLDFTANNKPLGPGMGFWVNKP